MKEGWENAMFASLGEFEVNNIMKIRVTAIFVQDQESALKFYTEKLGFVKKRDIPLENGDRWLTVVSKEEQDGTELLLEPLSGNHFKPAKTYQKAVFDVGVYPIQCGKRSGRI